MSSEFFWVCVASERQIPPLLLAGALAAGVLLVVHGLQHKGLTVALSSSPVK